MTSTSTPATISGPRPVASGNLARNVVRVGAAGWNMGDLFHTILVMRWSLFLVCVVASQVLANVVFALLFALQRGDIANAPGNALDDFYFSVQTWATIGYGGMTPATTWANMLVMAESITSMVFTAVTTGLVFAKFARPQARILFANKAVITQRDGKKILMVRVANERGNDVVEASARLTVLKEEISAEGERMRRILDLKLARDVQPMFVISWTLMHEIDERSPLFGKTIDDMRAEQWRLTASLTGHDGTLSQTIYASHSYTPADIAFAARYVDVISPLPDGRVQLDLTKFHDVEKQVIA
jgi:inward rectifier potassium channel